MRAAITSASRTSLLPNCLSYDDAAGDPVAVQERNWAAEAGESESAGKAGGFGRRDGTAAQPGLVGKHGSMTCCVPI